MNRCKRCYKKIVGHGHNGAPLVNGRVCDNCNKAVIQFRINEGK